MLLYTHPINAAREARGELAVNSFWLSGTGCTQSLATGDHEPQRRRTPARPVAGRRLGGLGRGLARAGCTTRWPNCDARAARGEPLGLTLCGERVAQRFDSVRTGAWQRLAQRWRRVDSLRALEPL